METTGLSVILPRGALEESFPDFSLAPPPP